MKVRFLVDCNILYVDGVENVKRACIFKTNQCIQSYYIKTFKNGKCDVYIDHFCKYLLPHYNMVEIV